MGIAAERSDALTELFESASHWAPSLIIFEDLDRLYGSENEGQNRTRITLQHQAVADRLGVQMHAFFDPRNRPKKLKTNAQGCCG
jgi:hypothetical protein